MAIGLILVVLLFLGNRGSGDDGGSAAPGPTTTTVAVPSEDRTATTAAAAPGDDPEARDEVAEQDATGDSAAAAEAVLQLSDLPAGWERRSGADEGTELCPGHDPLAASGATGSARSAFRNGASFVVGLVADFPSPAAATQLLESARTAFRACDGFVVESVTDLGDEAVLGRRDAVQEGLTAESRVYLARVGSRVAALSVVSFGELDADLVRTLVRREVDRL